MGALDEAVQEQVLARLPGRSAIEADLRNAWNGIAEQESILQTKLHYLDELIEIDLVLPASMCVPGHAAAIEKLQSSAPSLHDGDPG